MFIAFVRIEVTPEGKFAAVVYITQGDGLLNLGSVVTPDFFAAVRAAEALQIYADNLARS